MSGYIDNAMSLRKGSVNLTSGSNGVGTYLCVTDGSLSITWDDTTTSTVDCVAGNAFRPIDAASITITSGMFHKV